MERNKKEKRKLKIIYDVIPPYLARDIVFVEKKVSKIVKASYLFLKTSKYGSIVLVLGVALFGGTILLGFSPKTETMEIYPAKYEGEWQNMERALNRELLSEADILEFSSDNSAGIIMSEKKADEPEIKKEDSPSSSKEKSEEIEEENNSSLTPLDPLLPEEEISDYNSLPSREEEPENEEFENIKQEDAAQNIEPANEGIIEPINMEPSEEQTQESSQPVLFEENIEKFSFFKETKNLFGALKAKAESTESAEEQKNSARSTGLAEKPPEGAKEKFEDYSEIILPNIDGDSLSEIQDETAEETQTVFTKELSAVCSGFSAPSEKGELKKIKIGFSFAGAGKENEDDEIIIFWSLDGKSWNSASEFVLDKACSNKDNGGYFYADIFDLSNSNNNAPLKWEDVENIKVKFSYLTNNNEEDYIPFYLDAVWLEIEAAAAAANNDDKDKEDLDNKDKTKILSSKKDFKMGEAPEFKFKYQKNNKENIPVSIGEAIGIVDYREGINLTAEITTPRKETIEISRDKFNEFFEDFAMEKNGEISMKFKKNKDFKPGLYNVVLKIEESGETQEFNQDFTWGVLAINTNKSIYLSGEEAYLQMAALKDDGHTICDANLKLEIISPSGAAFSPEIKKSGECGANNVTNKPDYFAHYTVGETGTYRMALKNLDNSYEIEDSFEVRDSVPFEVERIGPTRIYPPAEYEMVLKIKANQDFNGEIRECVPESFEIKSQYPNPNDQQNPNDQNSNIIIENCDIENSLNPPADGENCKFIIWQTNLKSGESYEIKYTFDAPDASPDLHLLGPLGFYE